MTDEIESLTKMINNLSSELETVRTNVQKRKVENTSLKVLLYTGLLVLLAGFLYSNSNLQRAHMRSLEKNIISLEQRMSQDVNHTKMNLELAIHNLHQQLKPIGTDIFTTLDRMDYAISQVDSKKEGTITLINQVRLDANEFSQMLENKLKYSTKNQDKELINNQLMENKQILE